MPQIQKVFLGAIALAATLGAVQVGAVQLASGHDLADRWEAVASQPGQTSGRSVAGHGVASHNVNRAAKSDRQAGLKPSAVPTRTVSMRLNDLPDTSVLLRVPAAGSDAAQARPQADDCLRADGQLPDRGRKTAPARPLRDLIRIGPRAKPLSSVESDFACALDPISHRVISRLSPFPIDRVNA